MKQELNADRAFIEKRPGEMGDSEAWQRLAQNDYGLGGATLEGGA